MHTNSVAARHVPDLWANAIGDEPDMPERGDYDVLADATGPAAMAVCCPGCGCVSLLQLRPGNGPSWQWDGNLDAPTLSPSIHHLQCWHGWLRGGQFTSC